MLNKIGQNCYIYSDLLKLPAIVAKILIYKKIQTYFSFVLKNIWRRAFKMIFWGPQCSRCDYSLFFFLMLVHWHFLIFLEIFITS